MWLGQQRLLSLDGDLQACGLAITTPFIASFDKDPRPSNSTHHPPSFVTRSTKTHKLPENAILARLDFVFPPELLTEVLKCMEPADHYNMTFVSRFVREQAPDFVFNKFVYTGLSISRFVESTQPETT